MRDFRDAKAMAQTLRETLTAKGITVSHSETLELVSKMLGISDWNTLSALLQSEERKAGVPAAKPGGAAICPALPIRDFVPFPTMTFPIFVAREKTKHALDQAFHGNREVVLVTQRDDAVEEPGSGDVYEVGVLARLLDIEQLPDGTMFGNKRLEGAMKIEVQAHRRVVICRFMGEAGAFQAEIADVNEGPITDAPELVCKAVDRFESYTAERQASMPQASSPATRQINDPGRLADVISRHVALPQASSPAVRQIRDPGRLADVISQHVALPVSEKQNLLATLDPVARLEKVVALMNG
jgi:ATP-dependent Lon protease